MRDTIRQISVILTTVVTIVINGLANALPLNGQNTGQISDRFQVYFTPAGYVFSIWGIIYLGLVAYTIFQALPSQKTNPRLRASGWWISLAGLANSAWIFLWHYERFPLTLAAMLVILLSLMIAYLRLGIGRSSVPSTETRMTRIPFSIYLGWITVATIANITVVLDYLHWDRFGLAPEIWMGIALVTVLAMTTLAATTRRDVAYTLVILWALAGIGVKHDTVPAVAIPTWVTFGMVMIVLAASRILVKPGRKLDVAQ